MSTSLPAMPDTCWPVDTSCVEGWSEYERKDRDRAVALAGQTLRSLTGYRVGGCPVIVRPSHAACAPPTWRTYPVVPGSGTGALPWMPAYLGGQWLNIGCGHAGEDLQCGCTGLSVIHLPRPCGGITEVLVDGVAVEPAGYALTADAALFRLGGETWPLRQDLSKPASEAGTFQVTYTPGEPVDGLGAAAAGLLAGEYVKACSSGDCDLPAAVTQIVRQGVTYTVGADLFPGGRTGIMLVDTYIHRWNPGGLKAPSTVWSPDLPRARRMR